MMALRYYGRRDFRLDEIADPRPGADDVRVEVSVCGICGSDVHEYLEGLRAVPVSRPHPQTGRIAPIVGGHEFSGVIAELGAGVSDLEVGARVVVRPTLPCYRCKYCLTGHQAQCATLATIGISADGAFSSQVNVRRDCIVTLPDHVSFASATFAEPLACGVHAVKRSGLRSGAIVAVIGAGPIGLMAAQAAMVSGAAAVHVFDPVADRRRLALDVGATTAHDPGVGDPGKVLAAQTGNARADFVFECAGVAAALSLADTLAGRGGVVVSMGMPSDGPIPLSLMGMFMREKSIVFSAGYDNDDFQTAVSLISSGRIKTDATLTSDRISLTEIMERGFGQLLGPRRHEHCKILVSPV